MATPSLPYSEWEEKTLPLTAGRPAPGWRPAWPAPGQSLEAYAAERAEAFRQHSAPLYAAAGVAQALRPWPNCARRPF